jgi:NTE family protein
MGSSSYNIVLEGGGVKGIGLVGALKALEDAGLSFAGIAGTSAGAAVAALYAAGYKAADLRQVLLEQNFSELLDPVFPKHFGFLWKYGLHKGWKLYQWCVALLRSKGISTFADIPDCDLRIIASDLTNRQVLVFNRSKNPDMKVAEAVRMSSGIPFFFEPYRLGEKLVVDGGLLSNYPLWVFAESNLPTLGVKLVSSGEPEVPLPPSSFAAYVTALIGTMLEAHDRQSETALGSGVTIHVPTGDAATTDFAITEAKKVSLYDAGYRAAREFLASNAALLTPGGRPGPPTPREPAAHGELAVRQALFESVVRGRDAANQTQESALRLSRLVRRLRIDPPNAFAESQEEGLNVAESGRTEVVRAVFADSPADFERLGFKAMVDLGDGEFDAPLTPETTADGRVHRVTIGFRGRVLEPGAAFKLRTSWCWPSAVGRNQDYWVFSQYPFTQPIRRLEIEARFSSRPADLQFLGEGDSGFLPVNITCKQLDEGEVLDWVCSAAIDSPRKLYVLHWRLR